MKYGGRWDEPWIPFIYTFLDAFRGTAKELYERYAYILQWKLII